MGQVWDRELTPHSAPAPRLRQREAWVGQFFVPFVVPFFKKKILFTFLKF